MNLESIKYTAMKVGELAQKTGVSVRTLHYYDEIGLLCPLERTESDYRYNYFNAGNPHNVVAPQPTITLNTNRIVP